MERAVYHAGPPASEILDPSSELRAKSHAMASP